MQDALFETLLVIAGNYKTKIKLACLKKWRINYSKELWLPLVKKKTTISYPILSCSTWSMYSALLITRIICSCSSKLRFSPLWKDARRFVCTDHPVPNLLKELEINLINTIISSLHNPEKCLQYGQPACFRVLKGYNNL